jgi:signal transduction histidine kinase
LQRLLSNLIICSFLLCLLGTMPLQSDQAVFELDDLSSEQAYLYILNQLHAWQSQPDSLALAIDYLSGNFSMLQKRYPTSDFYFNVKWAISFVRGFLKFGRGDYEEAVEYYKDSYATALAHNHVTHRITSLFELANLYYYRGFYQMARAKYKETLDLVKLTDNLEQKFKILHNLAVISKLLEDYQSSLQYFDQAEALKLRNNKEEELGMLYNNRGSVHNDLGDHDFAYRDYLKARELLERFGSQSELALVYNNLGNYYIQEKDYSLALDFFNKSLDLKDPDTAQFQTTLINIAKLHYNNNDIQRSQLFLTEAEEVCYKYGFLNQLMDIYNLNQEIYLDRKEFSRAILYLKRHQALADSILAIESHYYLQDLKDFYELQARDQNITILETEAKQNQSKLLMNTFIMFWVIIFIISLIALILYFFKRRKTRRLQIETLERKNQLLREERIKTDVVVNMLQRLKSQLENQIDKEVKHIRERDSMILIQSRNSAVGEMIGNIAHQWRQPLNAIGIMIQDFSEAYEFEEFNDKYIGEKISIIDNLIVFMEDTIDDFKKFFSPDKTEIPLKASEIVQRAIEFVSCTFNARNIIYDIKLIEDFVTFGSENELFHALLNILNNAKDAFVEKKISNQSVIINIYTSQDFGCIDIIDNAGGIDSSLIDNIFEPYVTTKKQSNGTGIGLYIVKYIIEKHFSGSVSADNTSTGARFSIKLPVYAYNNPLLGKKK